MRNSTRTWIIVANRVQAGIYAYDPKDRNIKTIRMLDHEAGRKRRREIETSRPGGSVGPTGRSFHAMVREKHDAVREQAERFSRRLAKWLNGEHQRGAFERAVLAAEPRFLGMLRGQLHNGTLGALRKTVRKDLAFVPAHDLPKHLGLRGRSHRSLARAKPERGRRKHGILV